MDSRRNDATASRDTNNREPRASMTSGKAPRGSMSNWGPAAPNAAQNQPSGAPRLSSTGGGSFRQRHSARNSIRNSRRGSQMGHGGGGEGQQTLQVIDEDGVDRTPKPLLSVKPSVLKGMGMGAGAHDDTTSPASEAGSEFFLDRMSSAAFSRQAGTGWGSGTNSGAITPTKSDMADEDYETQREKAKAMAAAAAAEEQAEMNKAEEAERSHQPTPAPEVHQLLTDKDLDAMVDITLSETATDFLLSMPCVTVSMESEEAALVEAANTRYTQLLAIKAAADKYTDQEAQTLNPLMKAREIQSCILTTNSTGCQATPWDIADTEHGREAGDPHAAGGNAMPSVSQLAGAVAHGDMYAPRGGGGGWNGSTTGGSYMQNGSMRNMGSMARSGSIMRASTAVMSWAQGSTNTTVPGMIPSVPGSRGDPSGNGGLPEGPVAEGAAPVIVSVDPLLMLRDLLPALNVMEMALCQNTYLPKLLQYRDITPIPHRPEPMPLPHHHALDPENSKQASQAPSRAMSRLASRQVSESGSQAVVEISRAQSLTHLSAASERLDPNANTANNQASKPPGGGPPAGYAASMAESAWPEEMLQDLADLGPDGVPRMDPLWTWSCPLMGDLQVVCMAWNKKAPDMLAVGYGTQAFSKAAAAAGMGSGCYGSTSTPPAATAGAPANGSTRPVSVGEGEGKATQTGAVAAAGQPVHGMVAFWSLKHPEFPLWHFRTRSGVTALDFATHQPNILAVGLYDGSVAVYDVKAQQGTPAMESDSHTGRHSDPVWKVQWIDRGHERDEPLVSISTDGRVTQWSIAKGLEFSDLMALKRVPRKATAAAAQPNAATAAAAAAAAAKGKSGPPVGEGDAFISRLTSGMSFDFSAKDQRIYIAGTEDGWIHRCSTSYSEQYLESYEGHMGPVYALRWSPFRPNMWASASADWTLRLWQEGRPSALLSFQSGSHEVNDVQWCPTNSTVFGSVTSGGRLEVWDFGLSTVKPVITHKAGTKLSCLLFSPNSPVVVCGSETGQVMVFRLYNIEREYDTPEEQLSRLEDVIRANVMKTQPGVTV